MIIGNYHSMMESAGTDPASQTQAIRSIGLQLSEDRNRTMFDDGSTKITMGEVMEGDFENDWIKAGTALVMENTRQYFASMSEATKLLNIGDFEKYAFNMVRALFPSLAAHEFASVQAMAGPVSLLFYQKFIYNKTKGTALAGQDVIENPNETYSSEIIDSEQIDVGDGGTANYTGNLSYSPVKAGTVQITSTVSAAPVTVTDDGNGNLVGDIAAGNNAINYATGAYDVTFSGNIDAAEPINSTYTYDMEANDDLPEIDLTLTSTPVTAIPHKLRTRWSVEAMQDLKNLHGDDAAIEQTAAITSELKFEIDRTVIRDINNIAQNTVTAFSKTVPTGISFTEHKLSFVDKLIEASNLIFSSTQRGVGTWVNAGIDVCSLIESLPGFNGAPKPANTRGVYKTGRLNNQWDIWKDPTFPGPARNQTNSDGYTMGYKGTSTMWEVGYIFAPYILAYATPEVYLDDFIGRKGIASRYGKKAVDGRFFATGSVTA